MSTARRVLILLVFCLVSSRSVALAQAQMSVNGTVPPQGLSLQAGSVVTVAISNDTATTTDWIGLYAAGTGNGAYLDWKYLSGDTAPPTSAVTNATIPLLLPVQPGDYEVRLFASNGYQQLAVSTASPFCRRRRRSPSTEPHLPP